MAKSSGTDTGRDGETAHNTPSHQDNQVKPVETDHQTANPDNNEQASVTKEEATVNAANSGVDYNERVGQFKEDFKQELAQVQESIKALVHKLDELG